MPPYRVMLSHPLRRRPRRLLGLQPAMRPARLLRGVVIVLLAGAAPIARCLGQAAASFIPEPRATEQHVRQTAPPISWAGHMVQDDTLVIDIVRGDVRITSSQTDRADLRITRVGVRSDPASVRLRVDSTANGVRLETLFPPRYRNASGEEHECLPPDRGRGDFFHSDVTTDVVVRVPRGVAVTVKQMAGRVEAEPGVLLTGSLR